MSLRTQRRLASEIMKIGENSVWIDPTRIDDVAMAIRREDMQKLIKEGVDRMDLIRHKSLNIEGRSPPQKGRHNL